MKNLTMLEEVLYHLNNWFVRDKKTFSKCEFADGGLPEEVSDYVPQNVFFRLEGTYFNDGLHRNDGDETFNDETVEHLRVSILVIPKALLDLLEEIVAWDEKYHDIAVGPFFQERFGGYEYSLKGYSSYGDENSTATGWRLAFADRLNPFRKMYA